MTWRVFVTRDETHVDGVGAHERATTVRVLAYPVMAFDTRDEAERKANHIRNAATDPTIDVAVEPPAGALWAGGQAADPPAARNGLDHARAQLRKDP